MNKSIEAVFAAPFAHFNPDVQRELKLRHEYDALEIADASLRRYATITRLIRRSLVDRFETNELLAIFNSLWGSPSDQKMSPEILIFHIEDAETCAGIATAFSVDIATLKLKLSHLSDVEAEVLFDAFLIFSCSEDADPEQAFKV